MKEKDIEYIMDVIYDVGQICCFFSVVEGFRDIGLFSISSNDGLGDDFFEETGEKRENYPPDSERVQEIENIVQKYYPDYIISKSWSEGIFFVYKKNKQKEIKQFYEKFIKKDKIFTIEFERELGLLLGYPKCCVKLHCQIPIEKRKPTKKQLERKTKKIIPFNKCSNKCDQEWLREFKRIVKEYQLEERIEEQKYSIQ